MVPVCDFISYDEMTFLGQPGVKKKNYSIIYQSIFKFIVFVSHLSIQ